VTSMRKLHHRLLRWRRYAAATRRDPRTFRGQAGHARALGAFHVERGIRRWDRPARGAR